MDGHDDEVEENVVAEFILTDDDMIVVLKSLDLYGYSMVMSENMTELLKIRSIAMKIITHLPKPELNS